MDNFWAGFEKRAFLRSLARGLGYGTRKLQASGASMSEAAKALPGKIKEYPAKLHEEFLRGNVAAGNELARGAGKLTPRKVKPRPAKSSPSAQTTGPKASGASPVVAPLALKSVRDKGKALLTGGLLGVGGLYMAGGGQPQQSQPY